MRYAASSISNAMGRDWYATPDWGDEVARAFEERLKRARPYNRSQYLKIKALNLLDVPDATHQAAARRLLHRVLNEYPDSLDAPYAHEKLGELYASAGDLAKAEHHLRACLDVESGTSGAVDLKLAEALFDLGGDGRFDEVVSLLERAGQRIESGREIWPIHIFRSVVLSARLAARTGLLQRAQEEAESALRIADMANQGNVFPRHPDLGKVQVDPDVRRELEALAQSHAASKRQRTRRGWFRRG